MTNYIITLTDRSPYNELDLRKEKLRTPDRVWIFKMDGSRLVGTNDTATYYEVDSSISFMKCLAENRFSSVRGETDSSIFSSGIRQSDFDRFLKFAKKNGKVAELNSLDIFTGEYHRLEEMLRTIKVVNDEIKSTLSLFRKVEYLDKKRCFRRVNCKNKIFYSPEKNVAWISNDQTFITKRIQDPLAYVGSIISDADIRYYSVSGLASSNSFIKTYDEKFFIYDGGKRGINKYLELVSRTAEIRKSLSEKTKTIIKDVFLPRTV
jgi:hypothetical protein